MVNKCDQCIKYQRQLALKELVLSFYADRIKKLENDINYYQGQYRGWKGAFKRHNKECSKSIEASQNKHGWYKLEYMMKGIKKIKERLLGLSGRL